MTGKQEDKIVKLLEDILYQLKKMTRKSNTVRQRPGHHKVKYLP
jgi:hypothetical protein|tara:strand:- start:1569 stop:1700 length:132 start_codon:yes stop_codon:yes gene_type:complete